MAGIVSGLEPQAPFMFERMMRLWRFSKADESIFATEEEFMSNLAQFEHEDLIRRYKAWLRGKPKAKAQELAYQAYESKSQKMALKLSGQALKLDPSCADAMTIHGAILAEDYDTMIGVLENAVDCAREAVGEDFFAHYEGQFWPMVELRPYMRCLTQLANLLWRVGRRLDAVARGEELRALDPENLHDNGDLLISYYLAMGEVQRSLNLLEKTDPEVSLVVNWAWVLLFLLMEDEENARMALDQALDLNPYVAPLLIGLGGEDELDLPRILEPGSLEEGHYCYQVLGEAWTSNLTALTWLLNALVEMGLVTAQDASMPDNFSMLH